MFKKLLGLFQAKTYPSIKGKKILIVDDGEIERRLLTSMLEKANLKVITANDGDEGLTAVEDEKPDLIVMDHNMPNLTGAEACQRLKANETTKSIPIIVLTGSDSPSNVVRSFDCGADQFLSKPVQRDTLLTQIEALIHTVR